MKSPYLRVKIKALAEESRIIRFEERRAKAARKLDVFNKLAEHRANVVRKETRNSLLAYQYLRGVPYEVVERKSDREPNCAYVASICSRFGPKTTTGDIEVWLNANKGE